jgi:hypothetical protein
LCFATRISPSPHCLPKYTVGFLPISYLLPPLLTPTPPVLIERESSKGLPLGLAAPPLDAVCFLLWLPFIFSLSKLTEATVRTIRNYESSRLSFPILISDRLKHLISDRF